MLNNSVIIEIRAGTGGDEAGLFARDLYKSYSKYALDRGWKMDILEYNSGNLGGFSKIIFNVKGKDVSNIFQYEGGVHRVQRVPITDKNKRIHTSTITVAVMPEVEEVDVKINQDDIRIDTFGASGNGGQKVNKTSSAVRIVHKPTGIVAVCQDERSQTANKQRAMKILRAKLFNLQSNNQDKDVSNIRRSQIGDGKRTEKIRTYNFPKDKIIDHRRNITINNINNVMEGNLDKLLGIKNGT